MRLPRFRPLRLPVLAALLHLSLGQVAILRAAESAAELRLDAREASRRILRASLRLPVKPGPLTLVYPKWIPGEHAPTGPITDVVNFQITGGGKAIPWRRDPTDTCGFLLDVPAGVDVLDIRFDFLFAAGTSGFSSAASTSAQLAVISWNNVVLYPKDTRADAVRYVTHLQLPEGWKYATALQRVTESAGGIEFAPATLETLVDSPLLAGAHFRTFDLTPGGPAAHRLNVAADSAAALALPAEDQTRFGRLVAEAHALFGARHYDKYDFLLTLSDQVAHFGLEHHESSDNRAPERTFLDGGLGKGTGGLLPHEMVHSWNGKYRRPAGIATPDYQTPMQTELLWVYEGLTTYLGNVLTARSGFWTVPKFTEYIAAMAAMLDHRPGRTWRPLADTGTAASLLYSARPEGSSSRRGVDFYPEGELIWLEADVTIRERTHGERSLDTFCQRFFGGENSSPRVATYTLDDVIAALEGVAPHDWRTFFQDRVYAVNPRAPLGGIERAGWKLVFTETASEMTKDFEAEAKTLDLTFSLGLVLRDDGGVVDVIAGGAADRAGLGAGMKVIGVNSRRWKTELLHDAIKEAKGGTDPIELLMENGDAFKTCRVDYHDGDRYPHLERDSARPDLLTVILEPRAKNP